MQVASLAKIEVLTVVQYRTESTPIVELCVTDIFAKVQSTMRRRPSSSSKTASTHGRLQTFVRASLQLARHY